MIRAQRGQAVRVVLLGVLLVADTDTGPLQQTNDGRQHFFPVQAGPGKVFFHPLSNTRQGVPEGEHTIILCLIAHRPPAFVVSVLLAAFGVAACRLQMSVRYRTDPDVRVGGRDAERLDPLQRPGVGYRFPIDTDVAELPVRRLLAPDPGLCIGDITQVRRLRGLLRTNDGSSIFVLVLPDYGKRLLVGEAFSCARVSVDLIAVLTEVLMEGLYPTCSNAKKDRCKCTCPF
jgi:hypothetical protein